MFCPYCNQEMNSSVSIVSETYPVKGEDITIDAHVRFCNCCHSEVWDTDLDSQNLLDAYEKYREKHGLLTPEDIRTIRNKYNLSQTAFARVLGLGDKTITRYENGSLPDAAQNNLIYLAQYPSNFSNLLEKNRSAITESDYENAKNALDALHPCIITPVSKTLYASSEETRIHYSMTATANRYWGDCYA